MIYTIAAQQITNVVTHLETDLARGRAVLGGSPRRVAIIPGERLILHRKGTTAGDGKTMHTIPGMFL